MDEFTFTANIVNSIAWPCAIVIMTWLLRKYLVNFNIKYKDIIDFQFNFKKEFKKQLNDIKSNLDANEDSVSQVKNKIDTMLKNLEDDSTLYANLIKMRKE